MVEGKKPELRQAQVVSQDDVFGEIGRLTMEVKVLKRDKRDILQELTRLRSEYGLLEAKLAEEKGKKTVPSRRKK